MASSRPAILACSHTPVYPSLSIRGQFTPPVPAPLIVSSTLPVIDSSGRMGIEPSTYWTSILPQIGQQSRDTILIQGQQVLQCGIQITDTKIDVSAETRQPLIPYSSRISSSWSNQSWLGGLTLNDPRLDLVGVLGIVCMFLLNGVLYDAQLYPAPTWSPPGTVSPHPTFETWSAYNFTVSSPAVNGPIGEVDFPAEDYGGRVVDIPPPTAFELYVLI